MDGDQSGAGRLDVGHPGRDTAGWYPDPVGDHDLRYHNGIRWTGDVSTDGQRYVAPLVPPPEPGDGRTGTLALVTGIIALAISWIPFVCVVGAILAVVAIVAGLRSRKIPNARGRAVAGIVTGCVALILAAVSMWLSVVVVQAVTTFFDPGRHDAVLDECVSTDGGTSATGTITNLEDDVRSYVVMVDFEPGDTSWSDVSDVQPGEAREFLIDVDREFSDLDCRIVFVGGPFPFGIELDQ